jgi:hypothetical protein
MSSSLDEARAETAAMIKKVNEEHGKPIPTALLPSVLRKSPLISAESNPNQLTSPIPELILLRVTAGLYYDLIQGGQALLTEANERFEQYTTDLISTMMERFAISRAYRYGPKGAQTDTPDVLVKENGKIVVAAECKATKLTYLAQFAEDPFEAAKQQYTQIAKGVFQLWRFFSHIRRGILKEELALDAHAMVITLDTFLAMARDPQDKVFAEAKRLADQDGNITEEDRRPVIMCPIYDLEAIFAKATEDSFLVSLKASYEEKYSGWMYREVHRASQAAKELGPAKNTRLIWKKYCRGGVALTQALKSRKKQPRCPEPDSTPDLASKEWRAISTEVKQAAANKCACCPNEAREAHHRFYRTRVMLGKDRSLLIVLCRGLPQDCGLRREQESAEQSGKGARGRGDVQARKQATLCRRPPKAPGVGPGVNIEISAIRQQFQNQVAEGVGFEPTIRFPVYTLSKRAPSATRPSLRSFRNGARPINTSRRAPTAILLYQIRRRCYACLGSIFIY